MKYKLFYRLGTLTIEAYFALSHKASFNANSGIYASIFSKEGGLASKPPNLFDRLWEHLS